MGTASTNSNHEKGPANHGVSSNDGILPRAVDELFTCLSQLQRKEPLESNNQPDNEASTDHTIELSYLEIYQEECRDLLLPNPSTTTSKLSIREDAKGNVIVPDLTSMPISNPLEALTLLKRAESNRSTGSTAMNAVSSRSHAICFFTIHRHDASTNATIRSKLTLVDLAGSERIKRTHAAGERMKEGININKGLFVLGQVVHVLSSEAYTRNRNQTIRNSHQDSSFSSSNSSNSNSSSSIHVPYRDSKLTRLLQNSLGGNSRTILLACCSPARNNYEESLNTLRYAQRARRVSNAVQQQVYVSNEEWERRCTVLRDEVKRLRNVIETAVNQTDCGTSCKTVLKGALESSHDTSVAGDSSVTAGLALPPPPPMETKAQKQEPTFEYLDDSFVSVEEEENAQNVEYDSDWSPENESPRLNQKQRQASIDKVKSDSPPSTFTMGKNYLSSLTVVKLKALLKEYGLPVSGRKADLVLRLEIFYNDQKSDENKATTPKTHDSSSNENSVNLDVAVASTAKKKKRKALVSIENMPNDATMESAKKKQKRVSSGRKKRRDMILDIGRTLAGVEEALKENK